jgi:biopolymer transport protein ExbD
MSNKIKKKSTFIDMTAMSDVTVLLLTFFMLTSTFIQKEPVSVSPPQSVSEVKIPESNIVSILIDPNGKVFMSFDNPKDREAALREVGKAYNIDFTPEELKKFSLLPSFGVPIIGMQKFLGLSPEDQDKVITNYGIPCDSTDNQFKIWMQTARQVWSERIQDVVRENPELAARKPQLAIAIKADANTPYPLIRDIMNTLQELREQRYNLITSLRNAPAGA